MTSSYPGRRNLTASSTAIVVAVVTGVPSQPAHRTEVIRAGVLAALGAWTIVVPYLGHVIGLEVDVASKVEVIDHVVPGVLIAVIAGALAVRARSGRTAGTADLLGAGACFLAGFWVLATHVPLLIDAGQGQQGWGTALWHFSTSLPIVLVAMWIFLRQSED